MAGLLFSSVRPTSSSILSSARGLHSGVTKLYVGADMPLFFIDPNTKTQAELLALEHASGKRKETSSGLGMGKLAEFLGDRFFPSEEAIKAAKVERKKAVQSATVMEPPEIPSVLPFAHWASKSEKFKETLVVDEARRVKPRLSWYHPDDTLVPRDWFRKGLLADIMYYKPFF